MRLKILFLFVFEGVIIRWNKNLVLSIELIKVELKDLEGWRSER